MPYLSSKIGEYRALFMHMTAREFAQMLRETYPGQCDNLTAARLGKIERGETPGTMFEREAIAKALGLEERELF